MPYRKKNYRKYNDKKKVTKQQVKSIVKKSNPEYLPSYKSIFSKSFGRGKIYRVRCSGSPAGQYTIVSANPGASGAPVPFISALFFTVGNLALSGELQMFDQYRIIGLKVRFIPMVTEFVNPTTNTWLGEFYTVIDYDDATTTGYTLSTLRKYDNVKITGASKEHVRTFIPAVSTYAYAGGPQPAGIKQGQWLDSANINVEHYGIKYGFSGGPATDIRASYMVEYEAMCEFRCTR